MSSKKNELTLESKAASNQLTAFIDQYTRGVEQLAVNPDIKHIMNEVKPGDDILQADKMDAVMDYLVNIANTDTENVMAVWISDLDASKLAQSDGYVSGEGWDITGRGWYGCITEKRTVLTEPYIDSSTGKMILSAAAPVYDDTTGAILGAVGMDISLDHMTGIMRGYKIGRNGYILLLSENGTFLYHPQVDDYVQKNIKDVKLSSNVVDAVLSKNSEFLKYKADGVTKYGSLELVGDTGYLVLSSLPFSEYYAILIAMIIALAILFAAGTYGFIAVSIRRERRKTDKANLWHSTKLPSSLRTEIWTSGLTLPEDEIGELGESIGKTVSRLKEYIVYIDETAEVLAQIAGGKLRITLKNDYVGEFQKIKTALLNISSSMNDVMEGINTSSGRVSVGASELATPPLKCWRKVQSCRQHLWKSLRQLQNTVADHVEASHSRRRSFRKGNCCQGYCHD